MNTDKAFIQAVIARRDREWEECLKAIDEKPPLVPDPEWFRGWIERVALDRREAGELELTEAREEGAHDLYSVLDYVFRKSDKDSHSREEILTLLEKELALYDAQE